MRRPHLVRLNPLLLLVVVLALVIAGCGEGTGGDATAPDGTPAGDDGDTEDDVAEGEAIRIGFLYTLSGPLAGNGEESLRGLETYIEQQGGQLGGRPVEIIAEDDESDPDVALRKIDKLLNQDGVSAVVGIGNSAIAAAARDVFHEEEVPLIITTAQANALSHEARSPYVFRTAHTFNQAGYAAGQYVAAEKSTDSVYIQTWDFVAGHDTAAAFKTGFEDNGGETIVGESYTPFLQVQDFQPFLSEIRGADPEVVYAFYGGGDAVNFVSQWSAFGLGEESELVGFTSLADESVLEAQGEAALGVETIASYSWTLDNPANQAFVDAYEQEHGDVPSYFAAYAWDAGLLLDEALATLDASGPLDTAALAEAIAGVGELDSPRGTFQMDPETNNPDQVFYVLEVVDRDGELVNEVVGEIGLMTESEIAPSVQ